MAYNAKTNWQLDETVLPADMNRIEQGIKDEETARGNHEKNKENPHEVKAAQIPILDADELFAAIDVEGALKEVGRQFKPEQTQTATLKHGSNLITTDRATSLKPKFSGRTHVNLVGKRGNCENVEQWSRDRGVVTLDSANKVFGSSSIKFTDNSTSTQHYMNHTVNGYSETVPVEGNKYYMLSVYLKVSNAAVPFDAKAVEWDGSAYLQNYPTPLVTSTAAFQRVAVKFKTSATTKKLALQFALKGGVIYSGAGDSGYVDGVMVNEISTDDYNNLTIAQLLEKYPYVESYQNLTNPYVIARGKNLLPPFSEWGLDGTVVINDAYNVSLTSSTEGQQGVTVPALPNQVYSASVVTTGDRFNIYTVDKDGAVTWIKFLSATGSTTFTTPSDAVAINIKLYSTTAGTFIFSKPMLNLGSTPLPFEPQEDSHLYLQTMLAEGETVEEIEGNWVKTKKVEHILLDNSVPWTSVPGYRGNGKHGIILGSFANYYPSFLGVPNWQQSKMVKYNGDIIPAYSEVWDANTAADRLVLSGNGNLYLSVAHVDSGWGPNYNPTPEEIAAYMLGWRMHTYEGINYPYDGTGTKYWAKIDKLFNDGKNSTGTSGVDYTVSTLPTAPAYGEVCKPHQLHYVTAAAQIEIVPNEGSLALRAGDNQVELGAGVIVREVASVHIENEYAHIGDGRCEPPLKYPTLKILDIYGSGILETTQWSRWNDTWAYGKERALKHVNSYDANAAYTLTYLAESSLLTTSPLPQLATYNTNDHTVLEKVVFEVAETATRLSVVENEKANRNQPQWIAPTLLNGWVNNDTGLNQTAGYFKDDFGMVHLKGLIKSGTVGTTAFKLPVGYRPQSICTYAVSSNYAYGQIYAHPDGNVIIQNGSNVWVSLGLISFQAAQ